jgi:lysophospholipase L1-like esterase
VRSFVRKGAAALLGTVAALLLGEVILRMFGIGYGHSPMVGDPVLHHWHPASYTQREWSASGDFGGFSTHFDADGLAMSAELPSGPSIVFLGDSFTEGLQVREDERFVTLTAASLGTPTANLGCSGFSPLLERLALERFAPRLQARAVVLQLYANDIDEDALYRAQARREGGRIVAVPGGDTPLSIRLARKSYLARLVHRVVQVRKFRRERVAHNTAASGSHPPAFDRPVRERYPAGELAGFEQSLAELRDVTRAHGWPLYAWVVPDRGALERGLPDYFTDYVREVAAQQSIRLIDLAPLFPRDRVAALFFQRDQHLNAEGHRAVATALVHALRR